MEININILFITHHSEDNDVILNVTACFNQFCHYEQINCRSWCWILQNGCVYSSFNTYIYGNSIHPFCAVTWIVYNLFFFIFLFFLFVCLHISISFQYSLIFFPIVIFYLWLFLFFLTFSRISYISKYATHCCCFLFVFRFWDCSICLYFCKIYDFLFLIFFFLDCQKIYKLTHPTLKICK